MVTKQLTNRGFLPFLEDEGKLLRPVPQAAPDKYVPGLSPQDRLYSHHTLASIRKLTFYKIPRAPKDSLDFILASAYNETKELFAIKEDTYLQWETKGKKTWRRLRNTYEKAPPIIIPLGHPIIFGGVTERKSPHHIKLMNSGIHSAKTAPGYSRQPAGGTVFYY